MLFTKKIPYEQVVERMVVDFHKLRDEIEDQEIVSEIDGITLEEELTYLIYCAYHLAITFSGVSEYLRSRMCVLFDEYMVDHAISLDDDSCVIKERLHAYFEAIISDVQEMKSGKPSTLAQKISFAFTQFCMGGGESKPLVIGDGLSTFNGTMLAMKYWTDSFVKTLDSFDTVKPK